VVPPTAGTVRKPVPTFSSADTRPHRYQLTRDCPGDHHGVLAVQNGYRTGLAEFGADCLAGRLHSALIVFKAR
jgi:hypothetical protein